MRILFISQYFPPEMGAPATRTYELCKAWVQSGHDVTVLTAFPHHPTGIVPPYYRRKIFLREKVKGINLVRTYVYATANKGFLKRTLSYISFLLSAVFFFPFIKCNPQVVIATSPQFFVAIAGYLLSRLKRRPFVFEVRDLWPESIVAVGALKNPWLIGVLNKISYFLYQRASLIVAVAESTREILAGRGIPRDKIEVVPNGIDTDLFARQRDSEFVRRQYGLDKKFIVSYIGTHGMAHALQSVLTVAVLLRKREDIHFLFVGEGAEKDNLLRRRDVERLENVTFSGQQDHEMVPLFLKASDVSLVPLRDTALFSAVLPSKIFEIMAASRPIILSVRGEAKALVERARAGLCVEPENPEMMKDAILKLYENRQLGKTLGSNGKRFVEARYDRTELAARYAQILCGVLKTVSQSLKNGHHISGKEKA